MRYHRTVPRDNLDCDDCGESTYTEFYVVSNDLWDRYAPGVWMICIGCLETRIGRQLVTADFTDANFKPEMLNHGRYPKSQRLIDRLTSSGEWKAEPIDESE